MDKNPRLCHNLSLTDERTVSAVDHSVTEAEKAQLEQQRLECGRSAKATIWNDTAMLLAFSKTELKQGTYLHAPPTKIQSQTSATIIVGAKGLFPNAWFSVEFNAQIPGRVLKEPLGPSFWFELKVPFAGEVICDYNCSHNKEYRIERYLRSDHREGYHISYCFRISMFGKSLGIEIKAPLVAETNFDETEIDLSYIEFKRITRKEESMAVAHLQREYPYLPTTSVIQPLIRASDLMVLEPLPVPSHRPLPVPKREPVPDHPPPHIPGDKLKLESVYTGGSPSPLLPRSRNRLSARPSALPPVLRPPPPLPTVSRIEEPAANLSILDGQDDPEAQSPSSINDTRAFETTDVGTHTEDSPKSSNTRPPMKIHPDLMNKDVNRRSKALDLTVVGALRQRGNGFRGRPDGVKTEGTDTNRLSEQTKPRSRSTSPTPAVRTPRVKDTLSFYSFIRGMSVMTRGSPTEKAQLIWYIFAGYEKEISCDIIQNYVTALSQALSSQGYSIDSYGEPQEFINSLIYVQNFEDGNGVGGRSECDIEESSDGTGNCMQPSDILRRRNRERNSKTIASNNTPAFFTKTDREPIVCLQHLIELTISVKPIQLQLSLQRNADHSGWLCKDKGETLLSAVQQFLANPDRRFFILRGYFLAYFKSDKKTEKPLRVMPINTSCSVKRIPGNMTIDIIVPGQFNRTLYCKDLEDLDHWVSSIRSKMLTRNRFMSFSPISHGQRATWFINGKDYYRFLLPVLQSAQRRVYIADWYFSPGTYLIRDPKIDKSTRIDRVLTALANRVHAAPPKLILQGVMIYLLIWNASSFTFDLQSNYVSQYLSSLHPNIKCVSHPSIFPFLWSHHQKFVVVDEQIATCGGIDICYGRYEDERYLLRDPNGQVFPGRDYNNINYSVGESNGPANSEMMARSTSRMPWHDIHMGFGGTSACGVAYNFIERWNHVQRMQVPEPEWLFPLSEEDKCPVEYYWQRLHDDLKGYRLCDIQILRSCGYWSTGNSVPEDSIYKAYLSTIKNAKHYIYIENQYFISSITRIQPKNKILEALYERLRKAIMQQENFRVIIILPVYPAGDINAASTQYLVKYTYKALNRQAGSLIEKLKEDFPGVDIDRYLSVNSLRNWTVAEGKVFTEPIYIHAKLMIVDDKTVIIGSANINDRSMRGARDSEICAITEGTEMINIQMNGKPYQASQFAYNLRIKLMSSFLGMSDEEGRAKVTDICSSAVFNGIWRTIASANTKLYLQVFKKLPDNIYSLPELAFLKPPGLLEPPESEARILHGVKGFLCEFPMGFLKDAQLDLSPSLANAEYLVPRQTFL